MIFKTIKLILKTCNLNKKYLLIIILDIFTGILTLSEPLLISKIIDSMYSLNYQDSITWLIIISGISILNLILKSLSKNYSQNIIILYKYYIVRKLYVNNYKNFSIFNNLHFLSEFPIFISKSISNLIQIIIIVIIISIYNITISIFIFIGLIFNIFIIYIYDKYKKEKYYQLNNINNKIKLKIKKDFITNKKNIIVFNKITATYFYNSKQIININLVREIICDFLIIILETMVVYYLIKYVNNNYISLNIFIIICPYTLSIAKKINDIFNIIKNLKIYNDLLKLYKNILKCKF